MIETQAGRRGSSTHPLLLCRQQLTPDPLLPSITLLISHRTMLPLGTPAQGDDWHLTSLEGTVPPFARVWLSHFAPKVSTEDSQASPRNS